MTILFNSVDIDVRIESIRPEMEYSNISGLEAPTGNVAILVSIESSKFTYRDAFVISVPQCSASEALANELWILFNNISITKCPWFNINNDKYSIAKGFRLFVINKTEELNFDIFLSSFAKHLASANNVILVPFIAAA